MRTLTLGLAAALSIALLTPSAARAGGAPGRHDGLYLHADLGLGGLASSWKEQGRKTEVSGGGAGLSLAVGGAVVENFVLAGRLWGASSSEPDIKVAGAKQSTPKKSALSLSAIGLDLTYYFMPINIFVTATPSVSTVTWDDRTDKETTKNGFALRLAVGKEWFVSDNWGLGVELELAASSNKTKDATPLTISTAWLGIGFSATYN